MLRLLDLPGYRRFWAASTVSTAGGYVTALAVQTLAVVALRATATEVGLLNAARFVPYLLLGLVAGVISDRHRRKPMLVGTDLGRAVLLCTIPILYVADRLTLPVLLVLVAAIGTLSLFFDAADPSLLPQFVPPGLLTSANARIEQSDAVGQTAGPLLAGVLIKTVGVPVAVLVDAVSYLISGLLLAGIRVTETVAPPAERRGLGTELREGMSWVYRHRMLAPLALSDHVWFLSHSILTTVLVLYVLRGPDAGGLGLDTFQLGVIYASAGVGALVGGALANRAGLRYGAGRTLVAVRAVMALPWLLVPSAVPGPAGWVMVAAAQFLFWIPMGVDGPNEMAYRQSVTPDRLRGRMNTTIRSLNRGAIVLGAPLGGLLADAAGYRTALLAGVIGLAGSGAVLGFSPFRHAATGTDQPADRFSSKL